MSTLAGDSLCPYRERFTLSALRPPAVGHELLVRVSPARSFESRSGALKVRCELVLNQSLVPLVILGGGVNLF